MNEHQARSGFKTFIITLGLSLVVFGALYYIITDSSNEVNIEDESAQGSETLARSDQRVFKKLAEEKVEVPSRAVLAAKDEPEKHSDGDVLAAANTSASSGGAGEVLAGADESAEATVPDTGSNDVVAMIVALSLFSVAAYALFAGPKLSLSKFERDITKDL
jgi:hypothetical protein